MVVVWLVLGVVLLLVELSHFGFFSLFAAIGAFAAALVAVFFPDAIAAQVAVAVVTSAAGILLLRPYVAKALHRQSGEAVGRGVHGTFVGEEVLTLDEVGDELHPGHVRLAGERWLAVSGLDLPIPAGTRVLVTGVQGTTLVVWPSDGSTPVRDLPPPTPGLEPG